MTTTSTQWVGEVLLLPSQPLTEKLISMGIPDWAIRLDIMGIMLPDLSWSYRNGDGTWQCVAMNTTAITTNAATEADARAMKLAQLLETGELSIFDVFDKLEGLAA